MKQAMRVGVTGASGFIGSALVAALKRRGDVPVALARDANPGALEGLDAIVHLAGETVDGRWTPAKKRAIFESRVGGTRNLVASLAALARRPRVLVSASAVGYYGDRGDELLDDDSPPGHDFLAGVCVAWEREAQAAVELGVRVASVRTAMVLGAGGALRKLMRVFRWGIGGPLGSGRQWMPWIHIEDIVELYLFLIAREDMSGPVAGVAPDYATNGRVMRALGDALHRPALAPAPGVALKIVLGEFAETLLGGQLIAPRKAAEAGFAWRHLRLESALLDVVAPDADRKPDVQAFFSEQYVDAPMDKVFAFFSDGANLARLTPPGMKLRSVSPRPVEMRAGAAIEYALNVHGVPARWRALIVEWVPGVRFTDVQIRGPYLWWCHTHEFEKKGDGVVLRDRIDYGLPFAPLSNVMLPLVRRDIEAAFAYRRRAIEGIFAA